MAPEAFCKSMWTIPFNRPEPKSVNMLEKYTLNGFGENYIDIYRDCYFPLDNQ